MRSRWDERRSTAAQVEAKAQDEEIRKRAAELVALVDHPGVRIASVSGALLLDCSQSYARLVQGWCNDAAQAVGLWLYWSKAKNIRRGHGVYDTVQTATITLYPLERTR